MKSALAAVVVPFAAAVAGPAHAGDTSPHVIGAYYPGYAASRFPVSSVPADRLTHLFYAFARIEDGRCVVDAEAGAHFAALAALRQAHPHLRTLVSIGGWDTDGFSDAALTAASRERFVESCMELFFERHAGVFDGVDIDWEFPVYGGPATVKARPQDRRNMTLLAQAFRRHLDALGSARGQTFLLTAALPAGRLQVGGPYDPARSFEIRRLARTLDFVNLMTYDMGTAHLRTTGFNAPLREDPASPLEPRLRRPNSVEGAIDDYLRRGLPANKLVLGMPFYGRAFRVTTDTGEGVYQPFGKTFEAGGWRQLRATYLADPQWRRSWHAATQSPWLYHPAQRIFVTYEDPESISLRAQLAKRRGLRGVFAWEITGDDDEHSLLRAMAGPYTEAASP